MEEESKTVKYFWEIKKEKDFDLATRSLAETVLVEQFGRKPDYNELRNK